VVLLAALVAELPELLALVFALWGEWPVVLG